VTAITLGRVSPQRLDATYPHTPGAPSTCAYLVLLRVEIARFTRGAFRAPGGYGFSRLAPGTDWLAPFGTSLRWRPIEHPSNGTVPTRLCCSDPHLTVDSH